MLGDDYRKSADIAWTSSGDAQGFHLLTATEKSGYAWQTPASPAEPGFDADQWIGKVCVTGSGKRAVVVHAPRSFFVSVPLFLYALLMTWLCVKVGEKISRRTGWAMAAAGIFLPLGLFIAFLIP
ncbi:hypothetical protein ACFUTR_06605 [Streptomyces sp. NPDC057367]|uniref:hypothetical protein n=1 Tax=Streptomyces sp. NPDC057367 TaxID=3346108 RepID=UPI003644DAC7